MRSFSYDKNACSFFYFCNDFYLPHSIMLLCIEFSSMLIHFNPQNSALYKIFSRCIFPRIILSFMDTKVKNHKLTKMLWFIYHYFSKKLICGLYIHNVVIFTQVGICQKLRDGRLDVFTITSISSLLTPKN